MKTFFLFSLLAIGVLYAAESGDEVNIPDKSNSVESSEEVERDQKPVAPWRKHDFKRREPEFLSQMTSTAKTEFFAIKFNPDLTKAEKTEQLKDWAKKFDKGEEMQKFLDAKKADCDKKRQERADNYKLLGELIEKADAILEDDQNTWSTANQKLEALVSGKDREIAKAFRAFFPWLGEHEGGHGRHHGHRFHHGKRFDRHRPVRQIGHGAAPKHHGIGHGAQPDEPRERYGDANENYDPYSNKHHKHHKHHAF